MVPYIVFHLPPFDQLIIWIQTRYTAQLPDESLLTQ